MSNRTDKVDKFSIDSDNGLIEFRGKLISECVEPWSGDIGIEKPPLFNPKWPSIFCKLAMYETDAGKIVVEQSCKSHSARVIDPKKTQPPSFHTLEPFDDPRYALKSILDGPIAHEVWLYTQFYYSVAGFIEEYLKRQNT